MRQRMENAGCVSYKMVEDGKIKATGLPMNFTLKKSSAYGKHYMQIIIENKNEIKFEVISEQGNIEDLEPSFQVLESNEAPEMEEQDNSAGVLASKTLGSKETSGWFSVYMSIIIETIRSNIGLQLNNTTTNIYSKKATLQH
ncbi:uncharacterized protein LOC135693903 [Rhopilema esculentum]|uniref:uncharacterized protein LOC135693903 n=1 Tax=Rhopilema esculentum TaxID=499914 RepID=UPI0031D01B04